VEYLNELVFASMGLKGVCWFSPNHPESLTSRQDWPTLRMIPAPGERVLLGGRDEVMRLVSVRDGRVSEQPEMSWRSEGVPNGGEYKGSVLALACGGAGVTLWEQQSPDEPPHLAGRYPFLGYARDLKFLTENVLLVADNHELGLVALDVSNPYRPRRLGHLRFRGYTDHVTFKGDRILVSNRPFGVYETRAMAGFTSFEIVDHIEPLLPDSRDALASGVRMHGGTLFISEMRSGVRLFQLQRNASGDSTWKHHKTLTDARIAVDCAALPGGRIAIADFTGAVVLARTDSE